MFQSSALKYINYTIGFLFLFLILIILSSIYNPSEKAKVERDKNLYGYAQLATKSINKFYQLKGRMPWVAKTGASIPAPGLPWTIIQSQEIGFCLDSDCAIPGEVETAVATEEGVLNISKDDLIYIGKGVNTQDPVYACFVPQSQDMRKNTGLLNKIDITSRTSAPSKLSSCSDRVTWRNDDMCYRCISSED